MGKLARCTRTKNLYAPAFCALLLALLRAACRDIMNAKKNAA